VQNNITKTADLSKNFTELRLSSGSYGETRATIDSNISATLNGHKFALRFNGVDEVTKDDRAHSKGYINMEAVTATYMLTPTTEVEGLYEQGDHKKPNGLGFFTTPEFTDPVTGANQNQASIPLQIKHPEIPWTWNWSNGQDFRSLDTSLYRAKITQSIGDNFSVQAYAQYSNRLQIDGNGWDANGSGGADSWESPNSGWFQTTNTIQETYHYRDWQNNMHAYGATGIYKLDTGPVKNTFAFGYAIWGEKELSQDKSETNPQPLVFPVEANIPINIPFGLPADLEPVMSGSNAYNHENNSNNYYYINWQTSSLDNRLKTNIGLNHTSIKLEHWNDGTQTAPNNVYNASKWSPLFGATYDVVKDVSVFAVHSTSLFPDTTKDSYGNQFAPQVGSSVEAGVKVDLLDQKITGTISVYRIRQSGGSQNDPTHSNLQTDTYDKDTPDQRLKDFPTGRPALGDVIAGGTQESKGIEEDLIFQPTRQWQILTSFAHNNEEVTASATTSTIGQSVPFHTNNLYAILTKYTFSDGPLKGLYIGGGAHGGSQQLQDYQTDPSTNKLVARYYDTPWTVQLFGGYHYKIWGYNTLLQVNIDNLTAAPDYTGWKATGSATKLATVGYKVPDPTTYNVTLGLDF
jgi:outer membrane receptor for ferric coprogen and ferric-rhodotorulic acid